MHRACAFARALAPAEALKSGLLPPLVFGENEPRRTRKRAHRRTAAAPGTTSDSGSDDCIKSTARVLKATSIRIASSSGAPRRRARLYLFSRRGEDRRRHAGAIFPARLRSPTCEICDVGARRWRIGVTATSTSGNYAVCDPCGRTLTISASVWRLRPAAGCSVPHPQEPTRHSEPHLRRLWKSGLFCQN
jgi:hypothetical protein